MSRSFRTQNGNLIALGNGLGKGGEGTVYEVLASPKLAAKIYHANRAAERREKIEAKRKLLVLLTVALSIISLLALGIVAGNIVAR